MYWGRFDAGEARVLVCEVTYPHHAPEHPLAHLKLASSSQLVAWPGLGVCPIVLQWLGQSGVCFLFVGDACNSSVQENNITRQNNLQPQNPAPKLRNLAGCS